MPVKTDTRTIQTGNFLGIISQGNVAGNLYQNLIIQDRPTIRLTLPNVGLPKEADYLKLLSWRTSIARLVGRDRELTELRDWAEDDGPASVRVRLLSGPGGSGKSRLAFELARALEFTEEWTAGFVHPDQNGDIEQADRHLLVIIDYAEQYRVQVLKFLEFLVSRPVSNKQVRVLLLSRYSLDWWRRNIDAPSVQAMLDSQDCEVNRLSVDDAALCFNNVTEQLAQHYKRNAPAVSKDAISSWIALNRELHPLPLFVTAAGIEAVLSPGSTLKLSGSDLLKPLANRERIRIDLIGNSVEDNNWASRLTALGLLSGGITPAVAKKLAADEPSLRLPAADQIEDALSRLPNWRDGLLQPIAPDLVGAQFLVDALDPNEVRSRSCLLAIMRQSASPVTDRLARIAYDVRSLSHTEDNPLTLLLTKAVAEDLSSARLFADTMQNSRPTDLLPALLAGSKLLASIDEESTPQRLRTLGRYSNQLNDAGEFEQALAVAEQTVRVAKTLSEQGADPDRRYMANSLITRSNLLARLRRSQPALDDIESAVAIRRDLASAFPVEFLPQLASSLQNLATRRSEVGNQDGADEAMHEALTLYATLSADEPEKHARELARTIHNYGIRLQEIGDRRGAVLAFREAVRRRQELVRETPNSDELDLTYSLHSLAQRLADIGEYEEALKHARAVLEYRQAFLGVYAKRVGIDLLYSHQLVSSLLLDNGRLPEAVEAAQQGVECARQLVEDYPGNFEFGLAFSLIALGWRLLENGEPVKSLALADQAKSILVPLATKDPARFETELANCQNARGRFLRDNGHLRAGIEETLEAIAIRRRLADSSPVRFGGELAASLRQLSWFYSSSGDFPEGYAAADEAVTRLKLLSNLFPLRFELDLAASLLELNWRSAQCGREEQSLSAAKEAEQLYLKYAESEPLRVQPLLAAALRARAVRLGAMDDPAAALPVIEKACAIHETLATFIRDRRANERFDCTLTLARITIDVGRVDEGLKLLDSALLARRDAAVSPRYESDLATAFLELAHLRKRANHFEAALQTSMEGEQLFRKLAVNERERFDPDLYRIKRLVSDLQSDAGYSRRSITSLKECITLETQLSNREPNRFLNEKAHDLLALSRRLRSASQVEQATQAANASVPDFSNLAKLLPERYTEDLGWALNQLATCQRDRGFREEALTTSAKSLCQMHFSARKFPSKANVSVANALRNASWLRARDGDRKKSLLLAERATRICLHALSQRNSTRNNVELARARMDLSHRRRAMGDIEAASAAMSDAVDLWRNLARGNPVHKPDLAGALEAFSIIRLAVDKTAAINSRREAISIYREISDLAPVAFEPRIADNLNELSNYLSDSDDAAVANLEAIAIFQKHAPDNHFSALRLAGALERRAAILKAKGIISAYVGVLENAVSARQKLMEDLVDGAVTPLVNALEELAIAYRQTGRRRDALKAIERAEHLADVHIYEISKAQVARIEALKQSEISAGEVVRRRISTLWLSSWRRLRT